jgi:predicted RNA-binding Zn-ribbon protein involved in translation (DUF1610 family)
MSVEERLSKLEQRVRTLEVRAGETNYSKPQQQFLEANQRSSKFHCKFCGQEILWEHAEGRWIPQNVDKSPHRCRSNP